MKSPAPPKNQKQTDARQQANERLAKALRDNLRRRKAQARARTVPLNNSAQKEQLLANETLTDE